jgi:hypothetical protein
MGARTLLVEAHVAQLDLAFFVKAWFDRHPAASPAG